MSRKDDKKMSIRKDCLHYHEEPYMGARVDCCLAETAFGMCPCTPECENYIPKDFSVRIVRCKDCKYWNNGSVIVGCYWDVDGGQPGEMDFCSRGKRKE